MTKPQVLDPGKTQATSVAIARQVTTTLLEMLNEYELVLHSLDTADIEVDDPLDFYDDLAKTYPHILSHTQMLAHVVPHLDWGWTEKLSKELRNIVVPEL